MAQAFPLGAGPTGVSNPGPFDTESYALSLLAQRNWKRSAEKALYKSIVYLIVHGKELDDDDDDDGDMCHRIDIIEFCHDLSFNHWLILIIGYSGAQTVRSILHSLLRGV